MMANWFMLGDGRVCGGLLAVRSRTEEESSGPFWRFISSLPCPDRTLRPPGWQGIVQELPLEHLLPVSRVLAAARAVVELRTVRAGAYIIFSAGHAVRRLSG